LLDIGLPVMDGYEVARRLKAANGGHLVRVLALTGYGQEPDRRRTREAGFAHHVVKPIDLQRLRRFLTGTRASTRRNTLPDEVSFPIVSGRTRRRPSSGMLMEGSRDPTATGRTYSCPGTTAGLSAEI
jgi:DNA-binding response OmpR family regulator